MRPLDEAAGRRPLAVTSREHSTLEAYRARSHAEPLNRLRSEQRQQAKARKDSEYVLQNLARIEYRTLPCATRDEATTREYEVKRAATYLFHT
ncbi:UNVERIFIED_ORG: hypothetical protein BDU10_2508 [Burkholderia sp. CF145]